MPHFALIDTARDSRLLPMIQQEAQWRCMFGGEVAPEVMAVAPFIVRLDPGRPFTKALQTQGWTDHWGITCHAAASLIDTRRMLRRNLEAMTPSGQNLLFRFYDPRVFVPFIEVATPADLDPWFDPVDMYWARNAKTGATMKYSRGPNGLVIETV